MQVAVIGFRNIRDFTDWCGKYQLVRYSEKVYRDYGNNEYYGIFEQVDLTGRMFDGYIEVDYLKEDLLRRIRRKENAENN